LDGNDYGIRRGKEITRLFLQFYVPYMHLIGFTFCCRYIRTGEKSLNEMGSLEAVMEQHYPECVPICEGQRQTSGNVLFRAEMFFAATPFGVYCYRCIMPLEASFRSLSHHVKIKHGGNCAKRDLFRFIVKSRISQSDLIEYGLTNEFLPKIIPGRFCGSCGKAYLQDNSLRAHCHKNIQCNIRRGQTGDVYVTTCGRMFSYAGLVSGGFLPETVTMVCDVPTKQIK
jgi:hypothetical protein